MEEYKERVEWQERDREEAPLRVEPESVVVEADYSEADGNGHELSETRQSALFNHEDADDLRTRWNTIQMKFVDEPRAAVAEADSLVGDVIHHISDVFDQERSRLETRWSKGDSLSTEDLRMIVQRYRSFFEHLLSM